MARSNSKRKPTKIQLTATQIAAEETVTKAMRQHGEFDRVCFAERSEKTGADLDGHRMVRRAPVTGLRRITLEPYQIAAANAYDAAYLSSLGACNHELKPFIDKTRVNNMVIAFEGGAQIAAVKRHLLLVGSDSSGKGTGNGRGVLLCGLLRKLFETHRDDSLRVISGSKKGAERNVKRVKELLDELAVVFGIKSMG
ncbi:MAG: hypothetical protein ABJN69_12905 [Hellea sp.]